MSQSALLRTIASEFSLLLMKGDAASAHTTAVAWSHEEVLVRIVRGHKMRTLDGLYDEFAAAFQFPLYFGENEDAFEECLTDLSWLHSGAGYVIMVTSPNEVLADAPAELAWMVSALRWAWDEWRKNRRTGESWDRGPVPFHVILYTSDDPELIVRWISAGATVADFG